MSLLPKRKSSVHGVYAVNSEGMARGERTTTRIIVLITVTKNASIDSIFLVATICRKFMLKLVTRLLANHCHEADNVGVFALLIALKRQAI
jgi:hypothetical protein